MKKTFNINIAGRVFTIDEDAYDMLSDYLDALGHAFKEFEDSNDLTEDIEQRVSELLSEHLDETHSEVVTISEVEEIIARIGRPEEILEIEEVTVSREENGTTVEEEVEVQNQSTAPGAVPPPMPPVSKRLFRDPDNKMLGGVCGGIGAYLNIDPTWIRLLFVALFFFSYSTIFIIYILLWIIVPMATTPLQLMQMRGEPTTVENIGKTVTSYYRGEETPTAPQPTGWKSIPGVLSKICGVLARIFLVMAMIIAIPIVLVLGLAFIGILIALIVYALTSITVIPFDSKADIIWTLVFCLAIILSFGIPLTMLIVSYFRNTGKKHYPPLSNKWKITLVILWILSITSAGVSGKILDGRGTAELFFNRPTKVIEVTEEEDTVSADEALEAEQEAEKAVADAKEALKEAQTVATEAISTAQQAVNQAEQNVKSVKKTRPANKQPVKTPADSVKTRK